MAPSSTPGAISLCLTHRRESPVECEARLTPACDHARDMVNSAPAAASVHSHELNYFFNFSAIGVSEGFSNYQASPQEFGAAPALARFISVYNFTLISNIMAKPGPMDLRLETHPRTFLDPTFKLTHNPVEGKHGPKPNPEPPPGLLNHPKPNSDSTELTLVENWARSSPGSGSSPDSTASSLTRMAWKPGHLPRRDHSDLWLNEPENILKECPRPATSIMDERARSTTNKIPSAEASMDQEGPSAVADIRLINTSLYHLAYILDIESSSFTDTVVRVSHMGQPTVFKPDMEFSLTLLQCGQILQDTAAKIAKHYFVSDPDPYKFDLGGVLAVHMEAGVPLEDKVLQLAALGLCRLRTGLKIIAQLQSVDESESVAYTTNSKAQGYMTGVVNNPPRVISPLAAYSE
ncbi:hypothetical protein BS47DRAFT_1360252 [Hydnum rufescens UP504]|uniref:Uncharacterized protein n=1 Tax=Hydnum rufescens UP504 TaxID=1448309 RepID=A0A9P6DZ33_9AGAM|nr:hypothetical protein BS47DRAFT_1360252 [Hydnum rufescens UP504]